MIHPSRFAAIVVLFSAFVASRSQSQTPFRLADGDRVVMIGDGLIEQAQYSGWIEVMMTTADPDQNVTFRNLGWNADTPAGQSRFGLSLLQAGREPADEGWRQLTKQIELTRPTVAVLGYGMASALEAATQPDAAGSDDAIQSFQDDYQRLVDQIRAVSPDCRFVCLSPIAPLGESAVDPALTQRIAQTIESVCESVSGHFVDLTDVAMTPDLRKDPVHLNDDGYRAVAATIEESLGLGAGTWMDHPLTRQLRDVIIEKNRLWFHRSRPANMAYVFGFRRHEQGQNAVEIPQFDDLIVKEEALIASLRDLASDASAPPAKRLESKYAEFTPQPTPEFIVDEGLEVTLWAENPLLNKPIHMNFDPQGRLWIASSEAYPMIEVGQAMPDKVVVLEDTNGDGKADKSSVFADQLLIPTGIAPGDGGVYVAQSTDLLFLKDTDGDGVADQRRRLLSGFGTEDTHHNLHTLVFGPDGRLYMNQSVYTRTDTETPHGVVRLKAGGGFRLDTRNNHMGIFFHGLWNPWGHQFDRWGNSFMTDGAGFAGIAYVFPGATFNPTPGARQVLDLISPGNYPKFCGAEFIRGESFPDDWQESFVTCDFRANRVTRFSINESDSGFVTTQESDLIRTSESTFRPIDVKMGPDGALYVADWSNPIINHGEVDFRDPRRDRWHGRIWRITAKERPLRKPVDLTKQSIVSLTQSMYSGDQYLSQQARRVLIERGDETAKKLNSIWTSAISTQDQLAAIRLSAAVGDPKTSWLEQVLSDSNGNARAAAVRILSDWSDPADPSAAITRGDAMEYFAKSISAPFPRARLETIRGLARLGGLSAIKLSLRALDQPTDRFIDHALFLNVSENTPALMADLERPVWSEAENQKQLEFVLTNVESSTATDFLRRYLAGNPLSRDGSGPWIELAAKAGDGSSLGILYRQAMSGSFDRAATAKALRAMLDAKRLRRVTPEFNSKPADDLRPLLSSDHSGIQTAAIELVGAWKVRPLVPSVIEIAEDASRSTPMRIKAIDSLKSIGNADVIEKLVQIANSEDSLRIRSAIVAAIAASNLERAIDPFFQTLTDIDDESAAIGLWRVMLQPKNSVAVLTGSMPENGVSEVAARAGIRAAGEGGRKAQSLIDVLMPISGLTMTASQWSPERGVELRRQASLRGDAARGEMVYRQSELQCATCHAIGGVGGQVGPDMTSLGASAPVDYIIESLFDPNAKIKENYHSVTVLTEDGQVYAGIETGSNDQELVLRDASNKLIRIPDAEVVQVKPGKSLMPAALLDRVSQQDQLDLIRFLTQLGKPGEFDASRQTVARVLQVFPGTHRIEQNGNEDIISGERSEGWKPLQARVSGKVDRETLQQLTAQPKNIALVNIYLRTTIEAGSETKATFSIDNIDRANLWIDGEPAGTLDDTVTLSPGRHTLLIQMDGRDLPEFIAVRSEDVTFVAE